MLTLKKIYLGKQNAPTTKKHLYKSLNLSFFLIFSSYFISQNIFADTTFSRLLDVVIPGRRLNKNLLSAVNEGNVNLVKQLLQQGAKGSTKDQYGNTALHYAAAKGYAEILVLLLNAGADPNVKDRDGNTPLFNAAATDHLQIIELLLNSKANPNLKNNAAITPLEKAIWTNKSQVVQMLLNREADPNTRMLNNNTALKETIRKNNLELVQILINAKADLNLKDEHENTALQAAIDENKLQAAQMVINAGADLNLKNKYGNTALHMAAFDNNIQATKMLINARADINLKNKDGNTALHIAASKDNPQTVQMLINAGADLNVKDEGGNTALHIAVSKNNLQAALALINAGADVNIKSSSLGVTKMTALNWAVLNDNLQAIRMLLNAGADPFLNFDGNNSLKHTIQCRNLDIINLMFHHQTVVKNLSPARKLKLIAFAIDNGVSPEIIQLIMTAGPKFPLKSIIQQRLLDKAVKLFKRKNNYREDDDAIWNNHNRLTSIKTEGINTLIPLLLRYKYEMQNENIPSSIKELVQKVSNLNTTNIDNIHDKTFLDSTKSLMEWIINQMPPTRSSEEFFKKIFQYLRNKYFSPEEQNLLLESIQSLMLHEYLLNPKILDKSDFEQLKKDLKGIRLENFQRFENHLRYIYAQELMDRFFSSIKEEDLINPSTSNIKTNQDNASILKKFSAINNTVASMVSYCQDMNYSVIKANPFDVEEQDSSYLFQNASPRMSKDSPVLKSTSPFIKSVSEKVQALQNQTMERFSQSIKDKNRFSMPLLIENLLEQGYNEGITKELYQAYKHLKHIIRTQGADLNSAPQEADAKPKNSFTGKDILELKK